jgi:hypothetical protein
MLWCQPGETLAVNVYEQVRFSLLGREITRIDRCFGLLQEGGGAAAEGQRAQAELAVVP